MNEAPVAYEETSVALTDAQAAELQVTVFPSEKDPREIVVVGACPRCSHMSRFVDPLDRLRSVDVSAEQVPTRRSVVVLCRCGESHPDPHDEKAARTNCGASFALDVNWGA